MATNEQAASQAPRWSWLPAPGTWKYHALLLSLGIFVLGPLGGVTASYMNFSLGFFIGGQVLAGILGFTAQEVAERERIPIGTAKSRIRLAMGKLRRARAETEATR